MSDSETKDVLQTTVKRGSTKSYKYVFVPKPGSLQNMLGGVVSCKMADVTGQKITATCTMSEDGLSATIVFAPKDTLILLPGYGTLDVRFTIGDVIENSKTVQVEILEQVTDA